MDPISLAAAAKAVLSLVNWKDLLKSLATDQAKASAKLLIALLQPGEQEKAAKKAIELFVEQFLAELAATTPLSVALPGYRDQLARLIELAAPDIAACMRPETKEVDLAPVELPWLKKHVFSSQDSQTRATAVRELSQGWPGDPTVLAIIKDCARPDEDANLRQVAIRELFDRRRNDPETLDLLKKAARFDRTTGAPAIEGLARRWKDDPDVHALLRELARAGARLEG